MPRFALQTGTANPLGDQLAGGLCCGQTALADPPPDPWTPWGAAGDLVAQIFGDDNYYLHRAIDRAGYDVNFAECGWWSMIWGDYCMLGPEQATHILHCYIALAKQGKIAEFEPRTATSGYGWGEGGISLARLSECALVSREACYKMMYAVYLLSMNGYIPDYRVLWPVTAAAQQKEREETPEGFKANLPGTGIEIDTVMEVVKWVAIIGAVGVGIYAISTVAGGVGVLGGSK